MAEELKRLSSGDLDTLISDFLRFDTDDNE